MSSESIGLVMGVITPVMYVIIGFICFKLNINLIAMLVFSLFNMVFNIYILTKADKLL